MFILIHFEHICHIFQTQTFISLNIFKWNLKLNLPCRVECLVLFNIITKPATLSVVLIVSIVYYISLPGQKFVTSYM